MIYIVKNGTGCKDNNKEYYSTARTGLKAALAVRGKDNLLGCLYKE